MGLDAMDGVRFRSVLTGDRLRNCWWTITGAVGVFFVQPSGCIFHTVFSNSSGCLCILAGGQSPSSLPLSSQVANVWFGANQEDPQGIDVTTPFVPESTSISSPPSAPRECHYSFFRLPFRLQYAVSRIRITPTEEVRSLALGHDTSPPVSTDWSSTPHRISVSRLRSNIQTQLRVVHQLSSQHRMWEDSPGGGTFEVFDLHNTAALIVSVSKSPLPPALDVRRGMRTTIWCNIEGAPGLGRGYASRIPRSLGSLAWIFCAAFAPPSSTRASSTFLIPNTFELVGGCGLRWTITRSDDPG